MCKRAVSKLVDECGGDIDGNELFCNATSNNHRNVCSSCKI